MILRDFTIPDLRFPNSDTDSTYVLCVVGAAYDASVCVRRYTGSMGLLFTAPCVLRRCREWVGKSLHRLQQALLPWDGCCYVIRKFQSLKTRRYYYWCQTSCSGPSMNRQDGQFRKPLRLGNRNNDLLGLNCTSSIIWVPWRLICNVTDWLLHEPESFLRR